jgi:hypothetical protein
VEEKGAKIIITNYCRQRDKNCRQHDNKNTQDNCKSMKCLALHLQNYSAKLQHLNNLRKCTNVPTFQTLSIYQAIMKTAQFAWKKWTRIASAYKANNARTVSTKRVLKSILIEQLIMATATFVASRLRARYVECYSFDKNIFFIKTILL